MVNSFSLRERAGERGIKKETTFKIPPHPNPFDTAQGRLLPQGRRDSITNLMASKKGVRPIYLAPFIFQLTV